MVPTGKYYLGATPEGPLSRTSFTGRGGSANSNRMLVSSSNRSSVRQVAQHTRRPSQPLPQLPPPHTGDVNPVPAPVPNPSSPPLRKSSFFNQVPGTPQGETPLNRSSISDTETVARIEPLPPSLLSRQEEEEDDSPTTRARKPAESRKIQARCGTTSSSRPRRLGIAVRQMSSCLRKTWVMFLGHLSHHVRQRQPRLRLRHHHCHRR